MYTNVKFNKNKHTVCITLSYHIVCMVYIHKSVDYDKISELED